MIARLLGGYGGGCFAQSGEYERILRFHPFEAQQAENEAKLAQDFK